MDLTSFWARYRWPLLFLVALALLPVAFGLGLLVSGTGEEDLADDAAPVGGAAEVWTCSMDPQIRLPKPGKCPICGMDLILLTAGEDPGPRRLLMTTEAMRLAEIRTVPVERRLVEARVRLVGKVVYDERRLKVISAWIAGRLDDLYVDFTGVRVQVGDHMVFMYSPEILSTEKELLLAVESVRSLAPDAPATDRRAREATAESVRQRLRLWGLMPEQIREIETRGQPSDHITIHAPIGGVVVHKNATEGMYVQPGSQIYTIADLSHVWVKMDAYEADLPWLRYGQEVEFEAVGLPGRFFHGRIAFIDPVLDDRSRTVKVRVNVENEGELLKPGMFVHAVVRPQIAGEGRVLDPTLVGKWISPMHPEIVKDGPGSCDICGMDLVRAEDLGFVSPDVETVPLVVPASAVLRTGTRGVVYVRLEADKPVFEGREVVLGPRAGDHYIVRAGLAEGEHVVVEGNFKIDSALQIRAKASMMSVPGDREQAAIDRFAGALEPIYSGYFELHRALYADQLEPARAAFAAIAAAGRAIDPEPLGSGRASRTWLELAGHLQKHGAEGESAADLAAARRAFEGVSHAVLGLERTFRHPGVDPRYRAHCPMAFGDHGADWLARGQEIENPFFGARAGMAACGSVEERFDGRGGSPVVDSGRRAAARSELGPVYGAYFSLHEALFAGDEAAAGAAVGALARAAEAVDMSRFEGADHLEWMRLSRELEAATAGAAAAAGLDDRRRSFAPIGRVVLAIERAFGHDGDVERHAVHCPMALGPGRGADWLQVSEAVRNPFFGDGAAMAACGLVKEHLPGSGESGR